MAVLYVVAAWLIMQVTEVMMTLVGLPLWTGQAVLAVLAVGFPIALVFSWFYELTPEGMKLDKDADAAESVTQISGQHFNFVIISLLAAAVLVFAYDKWWLRDDAAIKAPDQNSVAVLPFVNMSGNPENEYFSDGLTETLLHALAQLPDLKVPARTSSFFFKGQDVDVRKIASQLGVSKVLEGSVQRDGDKLRIVAQLIEAETGFHLWSNTYDREMSDIFAVQDDIANSVARALQVTLIGPSVQGGKIETVATDNVAAYEKYLEGLQQKNINSYTSLSLAVNAFKTALALDPGFYEARIELGHTYISQQRAGAISLDEAKNNVSLLLEQLREERPDDGLTIMLGTYVDFVSSVIQGDGPFEIERHISDLAASIERTPNEPRLYQDMANNLNFAGRPDEAFEWLERGLLIDPLDWKLHQRFGVFLLVAEDFDRAQASFARIIELNPDGPSGYAYSAEISWYQKQYADWFAMIKKAIDVGPLDHEGPALIARRLFTFGLMDEADKYMRRASAVAPDSASVREMELFRLVLLKDYAQAQALSESLLRNNIEIRGGAYKFALMVFMSTTTELKGADEALAVLEELYPGVTSPSFQPEGSKEELVQYHAALSLAQLDPGKDTLSILDGFVSRREKEGHVMTGLPAIMAPVALVRGQNALATELTLENLQPGLESDDQFSYHLYRHIDYYKALAQEPAVASRLAELDAEAKKGGEEILAYIVEHDLSL
jgi:TolB-like protein/tetratricopeptide (TPR) repeat protein